MHKVIKNGLLGFIFLVLLLPLLQQNVLFLDCGPLYGYYTNAPDVDFTTRKWFNDSFESGKNDFFNDHVGLRPYLLRLNGQIDFSLFQKIDYGGAVMGSDQYMYYDGYIHAYYGTDYAGYEALYEKMRKLKAVQDTLTRLGKTVFVVYAPCKAWFYPEHIPRNMRSYIKRPNNYKTCVRIGDSLGINQMDLNSVFLKMKDTSKEMLYAKQGIHWTNYGSTLGADTIIRYIEQHRHIHMPHPRWDHGLHTTKAHDPDADMGNLSNLIFPMATENYFYPDLYYTSDATTTKPNLIFVGDSYSINMIKTGVINNISSQWQFWFVFKYVLNNSNANSTEYIKLEIYDWKNELLKADCIVILNTPANAAIVGNGFIETAFDYFYPKK